MPRSSCDTRPPTSAGLTAGCKRDRSYSLIAKMFGTIALLSANGPASGQEPAITAVGDVPSCPACTIVLTKVAVLNDPDDGLELEQNARVARDSHGRYFAAPAKERGVVALFGQNGHVIRRIGRSGGGPGEFRSVRRPWVGPGDTLHVFGSPYTVFDPDLNPVRTYNALGDPHGFALFADGSMVLHTILYSETRIGLPLHKISPEGHIIRSFGSETRSYDPADPFAALRAVAVADSGRVWSVPMNRYVIELWDTTGHNLMQLRRDTDWFRPWTGYDEKAPYRSRARPLVTAVAEDAEGRLWVMVGVADKDWRANSGAPTDVSIHDVLDTIIEVIDPRAGRLIASTRIGIYLAGFADSSHVFARDVDSDGRIVLTVWRVSLETDAGRNDPSPRRSR